jgi:hypothetical protein
MQRPSWLSASFFSGIFGLFAFTPLGVSAAINSLFQPIIPQTGVCVCPGRAPDYGCALQVIQNLMNTGIALGVLFIVLVLAYAGFIFMTSGANPGTHEQGRTMITNAVVGLLVMLSSWLIVDFIMKAIYSAPSDFGPWNSILAPSADGSDSCIEVNKNAGNITKGVLDPILNVLNPGRGGFVVGVAGALCSDSNPACSTQSLIAAGLTRAQAQAMSCIAVTESGGNPNSPNSVTGACGTFQITNKTRKSNWQNPDNHGPGCSVSTSCNNARCNLQTAVIMFNRSGYQPWTGKNPNGSYWNPNAVACVRKYDPGR